MDDNSGKTEESVEKPKPPKVKKSSGKGKQKKKGYFIFTIFLFIILIITTTGGIIFLDVVGYLNISKIISIDSEAAKIPYVGKYIRYSYMMHLSDEERLKIQVEQYQEILENKRKELELKEGMLTKMKLDLESIQKSNTEKTEELKKKEETLNQRQKELESIGLNEEEKTKNIEKFAIIYSKMNEKSAAKIMEKIDTLIDAKIFEKMNEKQSAKIIEAMVEINLDKTKEIVELMTKNKGDKK